MLAAGKFVLMSQNSLSTRSMRAPAEWICVCLASILMLAPGHAAPVCQSASGWVVRIRALVEQGRLDQAAAITDEWLQAAPQDLDARAWHARLLAWTNRWKEAESEYHELIRLSPRDIDLLMGLADVLIWQTRNEEALATLDLACGLDPRRADCSLRRASALRRLGRTREARIAYQEILARDRSSAEARTGLEQIRTAEDRYELRFSSDLDRFSYATTAAAFSLALRSRWNSHWATFGSVSRYRRFGESATLAAAGITANLSPRDALTIRGAAAGDNSIIPRAEAEFEYGHGFHLSEDGPFRAIETLYQQRWLWYRDTRLLILSPATILYLRKEWTWSFRVNASRIVTAGNTMDLKISGWTRLAFPLANRITGYVHFASGTENFGYADQIGRYASRTWGGGLRIGFAQGQEILGYGQYQFGTGGRNMMGVGVSYALHF